MARSDREIRKRRRACHVTSEEFCCALASLRSAGIEVRCGISITQLDDASAQGRRQEMSPTHLDEIEMVCFRLTDESAGQIERRHSAISRQRFKARRYAAVGERDSRTAVKSIEPVSGAGANAAPHVCK